METRFYRRPRVESPSLVAAWPGMGYLAKISAEYLRDSLRADMFAEIVTYQSVIRYVDGLAELSFSRHRFYEAPDANLVICVGDDQPLTASESVSLAEAVMDVAEELGVRMVYTMAAMPTGYEGEPRVYGIGNSVRSLRKLREHGIEVMRGEGGVSGLNGILIGVAAKRGVDGVCLLGEIRYVDVPQFESAAYVLKVLTGMLGLTLDLSKLMRRAEEVKRMTKKGRVGGERLGYVS